MGKILVTGGAGFIGSCLCKKLLEEGHEVVVVDNLSTGYRENVPAGATLVEGDAADRQLLDGLGGEGIDTVFHLSGQSSGEISFEDPLRDLSDNVASTLAICDFMVRNGIESIFYTSSTVVYGEPKRNPVKEQDACNPDSFYGVGKLASENYLRVYHQSYNIRATCFRLFSIYGPGQNMANLRQGIVSIFLELMLNHGGRIEVHGSLERFRDLVHIDDLVSIFNRALEMDLPGYRILNVGTGLQTKVGDIIRHMAEALDIEVDVVVKGETPGDVFGIYADVERLVATLGCRPETTSAEGLKRFAQWYKGELSDDC